MLGFDIFGLEMFGLEILGFEISGFNVTELLSPFGTGEPLGAVNCWAVTRTLADGFDDVMYTGRDAVDSGGIVISSWVCGCDCKKEADPPGGCDTIVRR